MSNTPIRPHKVFSDIRKELDTISRMSPAGDTYGADARLWEMDSHLLIDSIGSISQFTKGDVKA